MGGDRQVNPVTGLRDTQFYSISKNLDLKMSILVPKSGTNNKEGKTPTRSNSSKYYAAIDEKGEIVQVAIYDENTHYKILDIDTGHKHKNKYENTRSWNENEVHVQHYYFNKKNKLVRKHDARDPTRKELYLLVEAKRLLKGAKK